HPTVSRDWCSDVCSTHLPGHPQRLHGRHPAGDRHHRGGQLRGRQRAGRGHRLRRRRGPHLRPDAHLGASPEQLRGDVMTENFTGLVVQSPSTSDQQATVATSLLQLQTVTSSPLAVELPTATGMVLPDVATYDRLAHFPEDLYDLRPTSHLMRLMKALLGEGGVGQLRKRYLLCQL